MKNLLFKFLINQENTTNTSTPNTSCIGFYAPDYRELALKEYNSSTSKDCGVEGQINDIRNLKDFLTKPNINSLKILFGSDIEVITTNKEIKNELSKLFDIKDEIATIDLKYLYSRCLSAHLSSLRKFKNTNDFKEGANAIRILDFLIRFANTNFLDFKAAISYSSSKKEDMGIVELLLDIESGSYEREDLLKLADEYLRRIVREMKPLYTDKTLQQQTVKKIDDIILNILKISVKTELL